MKTYLLIIMLCFSTIACKTKKNAVVSTSVVATSGTIIGKVSHQYKAGGCATVIIVAQEEGELVLIPKDKLSKEFDVDGLEIRFNYHPLKMPQPAGCEKGIPAEITDVSKK